MLNNTAIPACSAVTAPLTKHSALVAFRQILHIDHTYVNRRTHRCDKPGCDKVIFFIEKYNFLLTRLPLLHCKKGLPIFPSPAGMSLTKLPGREYFSYSRPVSDIPAGVGKIGNFFYSALKSCILILYSEKQF